MEVIGFALGVPGAIDVFVKAGLFIIEKIGDYKDAPSAIMEIKQFGVGLVNGLLRTRLETAVVVIKDPDVHEELKKYLDLCYHEIASQLDETNKLLTKYTGGTKNRWKYSLLGGKSAIEKAVTNLRSLDDNFSKAISNIEIRNKLVPSRLLLSASQFRVTGEQKSRAIGLTLPHSGIILQKGHLRNCRHAKDISTAQRDFILEEMPYPIGAEKVAEANARILASKLFKAEIAHGIPRLVGYRHKPEWASYELVFTVPLSHKTPRSLHDLLLDSSAPMPSLTSRSNVCEQLAKAVFFTHQLDIVHKNIRPQNLLLLPPKEGGEKIISSRHLGTLFLTKWELCRNESDASCLVGSNDWQTGIYQHPRRQGLHIEDHYVMGHDIYSLGVCMLEILLWKSLVEWSEDGGTFQPSRLYQERAIKLELVGESCAGNTQKMVGTPGVVQKVLIDLAKTELPPAVGDKMAMVVVNCLTALEDGFEKIYVVDAKTHSQVLGLEYMLGVLSVFSS